jgi:hypothetical protein
MATKIYFLLMTIVASMFIGIGIYNLDGFYLWALCLYAGGFMFGHLVTEALSGDTK